MWPSFICCLFKAGIHTLHACTHISCIYIHNFDADIFIRTTSATEKALVVAYNLLGDSLDASLGFFRWQVLSLYHNLYENCVLITLSSTRRTPRRRQEWTNIWEREPPSVAVGDYCCLRTVSKGEHCFRPAPPAVWPWSFVVCNQIRLLAAAQMPQVAAELQTNCNMTLHPVACRRLLAPSVWGLGYCLVVNMVARPALCHV